MIKQIHLETLVGADGKKAVRVSVTYRFGESMALCKTYPSPKSLQERQEGQEHMLLGVSWRVLKGLDRKRFLSFLSQLLEEEERDG